MDSTIISCIAFLAGAGLAAFITYLYMDKEGGDEARAFRQAAKDMKKKGIKKRGDGKLFEIYSADGTVSFEYLKKRGNGFPFYFSKTGAIAYDPETIDKSQPKIYTRGVKCYQVAATNPGIIDTNDAISAKQFYNVCLTKYPQLASIAPETFFSLLTTPASELQYDVQNFCHDTENDNPEDEDSEFMNPDELYAVIMDCKEICANQPIIPHNEVIEAAKAKYYRAKFYNFSTSWFASIMPYSMDSAKIRKALNEYESYITSGAKKSVKDIMPIAILLVCAGVAVAIVLAVLQGFTS